MAGLQGALEEDGGAWGATCVNGVEGAGGSAQRPARQNCPVGHIESRRHLCASRAPTLTLARVGVPSAKNNVYLARTLSITPSNTGSAEPQMTVAAGGLFLVPSTTASALSAAMRLRTSVPSFDVSKTSSAVSVFAGGAPFSGAGPECTTIELATAGVSSFVPASSERMSICTRGETGVGGVELIPRLPGMTAGLVTSAVLDGGVLRATPVDESWYCYAPGETVFWQKEVGDDWVRPGQAVPTCELEPAPPPPASSTARLKRVEDGVSAPLAALAGGAHIERELPWRRDGLLVDTVLGGAACMPEVADDGVLRCLPNQDVADVLYGDATCTGAPVAALTPAIHPQPFGRPPWKPSCSGTVYAVGAQIPMPPSLYQSEGPTCGGCTPYAPNGDNAYAITIAPPSTFAALAIDVR